MQPRSLDRALADLRAQYDRTPESSRRRRLELEKMIHNLEQEIAARQASEPHS
jgi:hypothetical protein